MSKIVNNFYDTTLKLRDLTVVAFPFRSSYGTSSKDQEILLQVLQEAYNMQGYTGITWRRKTLRTRPPSLR